jgi:LysM repeat protein
MGTSYTIKPGDSCYTISKAQSIGTAWLLTDNDLTAHCTGFPTTGVLRLRNTCDVATLHHNQTCAGVAKSNNITVAQLLAWNPVISSGCHNIARLNGTSLCISLPGTPYVQPATMESPASPLAATMPSDVANGTNHVCGRYYKVKPRDYCNLLVMKFGISLGDFRFLNSGINANCTNLFSEQSYCVKPVGDINTYSGRSSHASTSTKAIYSYAPFSDIPLASKTATISSPNRANISTTLPLAKGTRSDCNFYFNGGTFQGNSTFYSSQCELAASVYDVEVEAFEAWNKAINASDSSCTFDPAYRYCGRLYMVMETMVESPDLVPSTTESSAARTEPVPMNSTTLTQSTAVASPTLATPTSTVTSSPAPRRGNESKDCSQWHTVHRGDTCSSISVGNSIKLEDFYKWNPKVTNECEFGFWFGFAYCVGTA